MKDKIQYCASLNRLIEEWNQNNEFILESKCDNCNFKELCQTMNELKGEINYLCEANGKLLKDKDNLLTAHKKLEQELVELKQKAIVPKYNLRQTCFIIWENDIISAQIEKIIIKISKDDEENSVYYSITNIYGYALRFPEEQIFATREEAEQKLAEIGGKDE